MMRTGPPQPPQNRGYVNRSKIHQLRVPEEKIEKDVEKG
jgi:hypothetical protein